MQQNSYGQENRSDYNFYKALNEWNVEEIKKELEAGVDVNVFFIQYEDPLNYAARKGDWEVFQYMINLDNK